MSKSRSLGEYFPEGGNAKKEKRNRRLGSISKQRRLAEGKGPATGIGKMEGKKRVRKRRKSLKNLLKKMPHLRGKGSFQDHIEESEKKFKKISVRGEKEKEESKKLVFQEETACEGEDGNVFRLLTLKREKKPRKESGTGLNNLSEFSKAVGRKGANAIKGEGDKTSCKKKER